MTDDGPMNTPTGGVAAKGLQEPKPVRGRSTAVVGVRMSEYMRDRIDLAAAHAGVSRSEWVEWLVETQLLRKRAKR